MSTTSTSRSSEPLLDVRNLGVTFQVRGGRRSRPSTTCPSRSAPGEHVGLVGESGSGKSVTSLAIMGLLPKRGVRSPPARCGTAGATCWQLSRRQLSGMRGKEIAMVFQDPMTSLNPVVTGRGADRRAIIERHFDVSRKDARRRAGDLLRKVGIPDPGAGWGSTPTSSPAACGSGCSSPWPWPASPRLLIADEPTTALDVTIQAQVLEVLKSLVADTDAALLMITHDLGVVAGLCDTVNVMYSGRIVESAERGDLFAHPRHPYTGGLLASIPRLDSPRGTRLTPIPGSPTQVLPWERGCAFAPRCGNRQDDCESGPPPLHEDGGRRLRCLHPLEPTPAGATTTGATR